MSFKPGTPFELAADEAMDLIKARCAEHGRPAEHIFISFSFEGEERPNAVTSYQSHDDDESEKEAALTLFSFLLAQCKGVGEQLGLTVIFAPMKGGGPMS